MHTSSARWARLLVAGSILLLAGCVRIADVGPGDGSVTPSLSVPSAPAPTATPSPTATATPRPTPSPTVEPSVAPSPTTSPDDGAQVVEVALLDSLTMDPDRITVEAGTPVRFVVTNEGGLPHDFFIGTDAQQKQRESGRGEPNPDQYLEVPPGETRTLTMTFPEAGRTIAGCVVPGHYSAGMKATIVIREP